MDKTSWTHSSYETPSQPEPSTQVKIKPTQATIEYFIFTGLKVIFIAFSCIKNISKHHKNNFNSLMPLLYRKKGQKSRFLR